MIEMLGVPCIKLEWETFKLRIITRIPICVYENNTTVWIINGGFLIIADKPENECGSKDLIPNSIPAIGFGNYWLR